MGKRGSWLPPRLYRQLTDKTQFYQLCTCFMFKDQFSFEKMVRKKMFSFLKEQ